MTKVVTFQDQLVVEYNGAQSGVLWVHEKLRAGDEVNLLRGVFSFDGSDALTPLTKARVLEGGGDFRLDPEDLEEELEESLFRFLLGSKDGDYLSSPN